MRNGGGLLARQTTVEIPTSYADSGLYRFSQVFPSTYTNEEVYSAVAPLVAACAEGVNGTILVRCCWFDCALRAKSRNALFGCAVSPQAYGQSRTGKTHIIEGSREDAGVLPRALSQLFELRQSHNLAMSLSLLEVRDNAVRDLIDEDVLEAAGVPDTHIRYGVVEQTRVHEVLALYRVRTMQVLHAALQRRTVATTPTAHSTFSTGKPHCIAVVRIERVGVGAVSTLLLGDLSGTVLLDMRNPQAFKSGVATNSNLVRPCACWLWCLCRL